MPEPLPSLLAAAFAARGDLLARLRAEGTDAYRLFHGSAEGRPGLAVDRYGDLLLVQSFHRPLAPEELAELKGYYAGALPGLTAIYNDRSGAHSRVANELPTEDRAAAELPRIAREMGVAYRIQARHGGQDPWLFLDLRAGRRRVMGEAAGKSLLNLFAYTCGVGIAAAKAGARFVLNVDFAASSLRVGRDNARLNDLPFRPRFIEGPPQDSAAPTPPREGPGKLGAALCFIRSDAFAALRQLAGIGQPKRVRGKPMPPFPELDAQQFDLVFLDPPPYAKSPFGVVDLVNDYPALFKPALLCTAEGGILYCCNNVAAVDRDAWLDQLRRSARKAGRAIRDFEWIIPEADFPSPDGRPPLKMLALSV